MARMSVYMWLNVVSFRLRGTEGFIPRGGVSFVYRGSSAPFKVQAMKRWMNNNNAMYSSMMNQAGCRCMRKLDGNGVEEDVLPSYLEGLEWDPSWDESEECDNEDDIATDVPQDSELRNLAYNAEDCGNDDYTHGLGGMSLKEISAEYGFPLDCFLDVLCRWGVEPPIHEETQLADLVNGEQAFSLLEMMTSVDVAAVQDTYVGENIGEIAEELGVSLSDIFLVCARRRMNLPRGVDTRLTRTECKILYEELGFDWEELGDDQCDTTKRDPPSHFPFDPEKPLGYGYAALSCEG